MEIGTWIALAGLFLSIVSVAVAGARMQGKQTEAIKQLEDRHEKHRQNLQDIYARLNMVERQGDKMQEVILSIKNDVSRVEQLQTQQNEKIDKILEIVYKMAKPNGE